MQFIIVAAFWLCSMQILVSQIKAINKLNAPKPEAPAPVTTKKCPYCCSEIALEATKCPHCTSELK